MSYKITMSGSVNASINPTMGKMSLCNFFFNFFLPLHSTEVNLAPNKSFGNLTLPF